jgi:membrane protease YdiL (CAAX protease family)
MDISDNLPPQRSKQHSAVTALVGLLICLLSFLIIGPIIGLLFALPFLEGDLLSLTEKLNNPLIYPELRLPLYIMQGVAGFIGLIVTPWLYLKYRKENPGAYFTTEGTWLAYGLTAIVVITFMGFNSFIIEWNAGMQLPDSLKALEDWARTKEDAAAELTSFLTEFTSPGMFILGLLVVAVIAAVGEEFVFRGLLQKKLQDSGMNGHLAIWISAILFSSIHLQFFGFVPRLFLGALFGYLYWWSGNLKVPILAHFVNNALTLTLVYSYQTGLTDTNIEDVESTPLGTVVIFSIITIALLYFLYRYWSKRRSNGNVAESL